MPIRNQMKLFRNSKGEEIKHIRISTLAGYYHCSMQSYLRAAEGIDSPPTEATTNGSKFHDAVTASRPPSSLELELENFLKPHMITLDTGKGGTVLSGTENKVFARAWIVDGEVKGYITTHGLDDFRVLPNRHVKFMEYKFTGQKVIDYYKLSTAVFQTKVACWIYEPLMAQGGYVIDPPEVVYLPMPDKRLKVQPKPWELQPLGCKKIYDYSAAAVESDIAMIFKEYSDPWHMIPPSRHKCYTCHPNFKAACYFQTFPQVKPQ